MKTLIFSILLSICFNFVNGQINYKNKEAGTLQTGTIDSPFIRVSQSTGNKIVGSIYLNEEWEQAVITNEDSDKTTVLARFNVYHGEIEILKNNNVEALIPTEGLKVFLNQRYFVPLQFQDEKIIFAELLVNGEDSLFKVYDIKINKAPSDSKLLSLESSDTITITNKLYSKSDDGVNIQLPTSKKELEKTLPKKMIDLAKSEKLSVKKENDLIKLFQISNSITN